MLPDDAPPTPRSHMVVRVTIDGRPWLADVGFGAAVPPQPLAMDSEEAQPTRHESYRVVRHRDEWQVAALIEEQWRTLYRIERSEEHTTGLQSIMRNTIAVVCMQKKKQK